MVHDQANVAITRSCAFVELIAVNDLRRQRLLGLPAAARGTMYVVPCYVMLIFLYVIYVYVIYKYLYSCSCDVQASSSNGLMLAHNRLRPDAVGRHHLVLLRPSFSLSSLHTRAVL